MDQKKNLDRSQPPFMDVDFQISNMMPDKFEEVTDAGRDIIYVCEDNEIKMFKCSNVHQF